MTAVDIAESNRLWNRKKKSPAFSFFPYRDTWVAGIFADLRIRSSSRWMPAKVISVHVHRKSARWLMCGCIRIGIDPVPMKISMPRGNWIHGGARLDPRSRYQQLSKIVGNAERETIFKRYRHVPCDSFDSLSTNFQSSTCVPFISHEFIYCRSWKSNDRLSSLVRKIFDIHSCEYLFRRQFFFFFCSLHNFEKSIYLSWITFVFVLVPIYKSWKLNSLYTNWFARMSNIWIFVLISGNFLLRDIQYGNNESYY